MEVKVKFLRFLIIFLLILLPCFAVSGQAITLTIEDAVQRAMDQSINLKRGAIDLAQAGYSASRLWSEIFPGFSLNVGFNFLPGTPLLTDPGFTYRDEALAYSINLGLSLSLNPSIASSMRRIELAYRSQLLSYEQAMRQLEIQVIKNFLSLINSREQIAFMNENYELATQNLNQDRIAWQNGMLNELAWLNSQLSVQTARYNLSMARGAYQIALEDFLALLGMDTGTDIILEGNIEIIPVIYDPDELIGMYLHRRPDIIAQQQTIERLELTRNINTLSSRSPGLNLSAQWRGGPGSGGLSAPFTDNISGTVTLSIPVDSWIPGTRQNQNLRAADAELEKANLDLQNTRTRAIAQIRSLVLNLANTLESLEIARQRMEIARRTLQATEIGFRNGTVQYRVLEEARRDLADATQRLLTGEFSYQSMLLDLAAALNVDWRTLTRR
ncbi:MAG: TolC family protein [Treponema sp.]|nr:TolC family protein [Treponema sp.]